MPIIRGSVDQPMTAYRISSIVGMILFLRQKHNDRSAQTRIVDHLRELLELLTAIVEDDRDREMYRRHKEGRMTMVTTQMAVAGLVTESLLSPKQFELVCVIIGQLLRITPYSSWSKNSREFLLRLLSLSLYNSKNNQPTPHQVTLSALLCGRMVLGSMLMRKLGLKKKVASLASWIRADLGIIDEKNIAPICCVDEDIIKSLRSTFKLEQGPQNATLENEIYENALPLIVCCIDIILCTKHSDLRSVALDCVYSFNGWLDSWRHFDTSIPALSSKIANTLSSKRNMGHECIIGCIRNIEIVICRCLGDSVLHHLKSSSKNNTKPNVHYLNTAKSFESHLKEYQENIIKVCRIVSDFKDNDDVNVRMAVSNFLGSVCHHCSEILEPYYLDAFTVLTHLSKDLDSKVAANAREIVLTIAMTNTAEKIISDRIYPLIESLPLVESRDLGYIAEKIDALDGMIEFLPRASPCISLLLKKVVLSIIDVAVRNDIALVPSYQELACYDMGPDILLRRPESTHTYTKSLHTAFFKPLEKLVSRMAAVNFSSFREIINLVSPFLEPGGYPQRYQESATCIVLCVLNALTANVEYNKTSAVIDIIDMLYPLAAPERVFSVVAGNYSQSSSTTQSCSPVCMVNILNCVNIAHQVLSTSAQSILLPKWLYITLSKLNYTNDAVDVAAKQALLSIARVSTLVQNCASPEDAVETLIVSYADYILNTSISMLLQPNPGVEAFYLLFSVIKCRGSAHIKYLNNVIDEILLLLAKSWCSSDDSFEILVTIIDTLSQRLLELSLGPDVQKVRGLIWKGHNEVSTTNNREILSSNDTLNEGSLKLKKALSDVYEVPLSLLSSCSPEFQEFYIKHANAKSENLGLQDVVINSNQSQVKIIDEDLRLYEDMAIKILSVLHRYTGSYRVHTRKAVLNSISHLFAIFIPKADKVLPEIHKKWICVTNRLMDSSFEVVYAAARCILIMCQVDPKFTVKKVNKDLFPDLIKTLQKSELEYRNLSSTPRSSSRLLYKREPSIITVSKTLSGSHTIPGLIFNLAAEIIRFNVEIIPESANRITVLAFRCLNSSNYTVDLSEHAKNLLDAILNADSNSDYAWMLSWVALGATRCFYDVSLLNNNELCTTPTISSSLSSTLNEEDPEKLGIEIPLWMIQAHRNLIVPSIEYKLNILDLVLRLKNSHEGHNSLQKLRSVLETKGKILLRDNKMFWEINIEHS